MPEWLVERGIGETRAALVEDGEIVEARVRRDGVIPAGTVLEAKLVAVAPRVSVEARGETFLLPRGVVGVSEGRSLIIEVTREALGGAEAWKRGLARIASGEPGDAPPLAEGREGVIEPWDDLLEEARSGIVTFNGGELRIEPTAAMTMIDVDGWLEPAQLAQVAAWAGRARSAGSISAARSASTSRRLATSKRGARSTRSSKTICRNRQSVPRSTASASSKSSVRGPGHPSLNSPVTARRSKLGRCFVGQASNRPGASGLSLTLR